jgi:LmbE family N-acetylglucosaminyl deacetylase
VPRTLVSFHAHPDDEVIATGGVIARAAREGHRVVVVFATRGELGEIVPGVLEPGESLADRRVAEAHAAADVLGAARVEFLGYRDSGMAGEPTNDDDVAFARADLDEAGARLAAILAEERADALTVYDPIGTYGHPDHIQVHRVGIRAGELAAVDAVYQATMNREHVYELVRDRPDERPPEFDDLPPIEEFEFGTRAAEITTAVDVSDLALLKREALACHRSQVAPDHFFLTMPPESYTVAFGTEWFIRPGAGPGIEHRPSLL